MGANETANIHAKVFPQKRKVKKTTPYLKPGLERLLPKGVSF